MQGGITAARVEVTPDLIRDLRAHKVQAANSGPHDLVFTTREGTGQDHRNIGGRIMARAVTRAGLEAVIGRDGAVEQRAPTFHDLRHSHASQLIAAGWDIAEVSARLGHANAAITQRIYVHQFDAARRSDDRRDRLARLYERPAPGSILGASGVRTRRAPTAPKWSNAGKSSDRLSRSERP